MGRDQFPLADQSQFPATPFPSQTLPASPTSGHNNSVRQDKPKIAFVRRIFSSRGVNDMNASGQIVAYAIRTSDGAGMGVILTPNPEPSSACILLLAGTGLLLRRRARLRTLPIL